MDDAAPRPPAGIPLTDDEKKFLTNPIRVRPLTSPCQAFLRDVYTLAAYDHLTSELTRKADAAEGVPIRAEDRDEDGIATHQAWEASLPNTLALAESTVLVCEMYCCRLVDSFLSYLSDLLTFVFEARPELFRTDEQLKADVILQYETMAELRAAMVEQKVISLAMKSLRDLDKYFKSVFGFDLFDGDWELVSISDLVELRNLIIHNRSVVNRRFQKHFSRPSKVGVVIHVGRDHLISTFGILVKAALRIDGRAAAQFRLASELFDLPALHAPVAKASMTFRLHEGNFPYVEPEFESSTGSDGMATDV